MCASPTRYHPAPWQGRQQPGGPPVKQEPITDRHHQQQQPCRCASAEAVAGLLADRPRAVAALTKIFLTEIERSVFVQMCGELQASDTIGWLFCVRRDRMARPQDIDMFEMAITETRLAHSGITIVYSDRTITPADVDRDLFSQVLLSTVEYKGAGDLLVQHAERVITAQQRLAREVWCTGGKPLYGFARYEFPPNGGPSVLPAAALDPAVQRKLAAAVDGAGQAGATAPEINSGAPGRAGHGEELRNREVAARRRDDVPMDAADPPAHGDGRERRPTGTVPEGIAPSRAPLAIAAAGLEPATPGL